MRGSNSSRAQRVQCFCAKLNYSRAGGFFFLGLKRKKLNKEKKKLPRPTCAHAQELQVPRDRFFFSLFFCSTRTLAVGGPRSPELSCTPKHQTRSSFWACSRPLIAILIAAILSNYLFCVFLNVGIPHKKHPSLACHQNNSALHKSTVVSPLLHLQTTRWSPPRTLPADTSTLPLICPL